MAKSDRDDWGNHVTGYCPMGCGATLFVAVGGYITCSFIECPNPTAVSDILLDSETQHVVTFREDHFTIRHPLKERVGDALMTCDLHAHVADLSGPPVQPGRYHAIPDGLGDYRWSRLVTVVSE